MSEFTQHQSERVELLHQLYSAISLKNKAYETIKENEEKIASIIPSDIVVFAHQLTEQISVLEDSLYTMGQLKTGLNKLLNVTYKAISNYPYHKPKKNSYFDLCIQNNLAMVKLVESIRPILIKLNKDLTNTKLRTDFLEQCKELNKFESYYIIKENVLFPLIEKHILEHKCIHIMWSFHDDIRSNLKKLIHILDSNLNLDLKELNRTAGDLIFNLYAVKFREERILFPYLEEKLSEELIESLWNESINIGFPYLNPTLKLDKAQNNKPNNFTDCIDLKTGTLSIEQLILIFNHLPVDITYVDDEGRVKFFSNPPHRIFPRTTAIIGRDVKNCHPHESVHVVQKIVESFRDGSKDHADFWINMKGKRILIQYFAVRDAQGKYRGVLEASQEISYIQSLEGERRILDWE